MSCEIKPTTTFKEELQGKSLVRTKTPKVTKYILYLFTTRRKKKLWK